MIKTGKIWPRSCLAAAIVWLFAAGCSSSSDDGGSSSSGFECVGQTAPAAACCDVGNATVDICVRCSGYSAQTCGDAVQSAIDDSSLGQGCAGADDIRDSDALYNECLPALTTISCADVEAGNLPASCQDQILYQI